MNESARLMVQQSIEQLNKRSDQLYDIFYTQLYKQIPESKSLFRSPAAEKTKLISMLATLGKLKHFDSLKPAIKALGKRHAAYGVTPDMYPKFKQVIIDSVSVTLADQASDETIQAWDHVLEAVIQNMQEGIPHE